MPSLSAAANLLLCVRRFDPKVDVASSTAVKSSVQRGMRAKLLEQYPDTLAKDDAVLLESIWPKKEGITLVKFRCVQTVWQTRIWERGPFAARHRRRVRAGRRLWRHVTGTGEKRCQRERAPS